MYSPNTGKIVCYETDGKGERVLADKSNYQRMKHLYKEQQKHKVVQNKMKEIQEKKDRIARKKKFLVDELEIKSH
jgi:hypothetical protein